MFCCCVVGASGASFFLNLLLGVSVCKRDCWSSFLFDIPKPATQHTRRIKKNKCRNKTGTQKTSFIISLCNVPDPDESRLKLHLAHQLYDVFLIYVNRLKCLIINKFLQRLDSDVFISLVTSTNATSFYTSVFGENLIRNPSNS